MLLGPAVVSLTMSEHPLEFNLLWLPTTYYHIVREHDETLRALLKHYVKGFDRLMIAICGGFCPISGTLLKNRK